MTRSWTDTVYERLAGDDDGRVCRAIPDEACREAPGNFLRMAVANMLSTLADSLSSAKTTLPWLLAALGAPAGLAALLVPLRESGSMLPQLWVGALVRRMPVRKSVWVGGARVQAACLAGMALTAWWLEGLAGGLAIVGGLALFSLARAACSIAYKDVLGKTIPKTRRGRLSGWIAAVAGFGALAVGAAMAGLSHEAPLPVLVGLLGVAALCWAVAAGVFGRIIEWSGATEGAAGGAAALRGALGLLRDDPVLQRFIVGRGLALGSALAAPLVVAMTQGLPGSSVGWLGLFIALEGVASLVSAPLWGRWADHDSARVFGWASAAAGGVALAVAALVAGGLPDAALALVLPVAFLGLGVAHAGVRLARKTYLVDIADGERRTDYVAVSNSVIGLWLLVVGGLSAVAAAWSMPGTVALLGAGSLAGAAMSLRWR